jgi:thymidine kinase
MLWDWRGTVFDDEIVKICNDLANQGIRVIVAGLDMDFKKSFWAYACLDGYSRVCY